MNLYGLRQIRLTSLTQLQSFQFIETNQNHIMQSPERINLFTTNKKQAAFNPEEFATHRLLQISDEQFDFDPLNNQDYPEMKNEISKNSYLDKSPRALSPGRTGDTRLSVTQNFTKSHKMWRKSSVHCIAGEQVCVMKKERVLNLSNFLILENESSSNVNEQSLSNALENETNKINFKVRTPKHIVTFIRRRNANNAKEMTGGQNQELRAVSPTRPSTKGSSSPTRKMNSSCELPKCGDQQKIPIKLITPNKLQIQNFIEFGCPSPTFRNKKLSNYLRYRMTNRNAL